MLSNTPESTETSPTGRSDETSSPADLGATTPAQGDDAWFTELHGPDGSGEPATDGSDQVALVPAVLPVTPRMGRNAPLMVAIAVVAIFAGSALFLSGYRLGQHSAETPGTPAGQESAFQPFWDTYTAITSRYAGGDVDRKAIIEGAIKGMFEALGDPYSSYLTSTEYKKTLQDISGEFEGIGAEIGTGDARGATTDCSTLAADCRLVIIAPIEGSPAEKAGLKPGDIVTAADGATLDGLSIDQARDRIRGKKGTEVKLTIIRDGGAPFDIAIIRDVIHQREVIVRDLAGGVGYIRLTGFSENAAKEFTKALKEDIDAGRTKIVLDLRGNPGGFVTAARTITSQFIGSGPLFWQEDARGNQQATDAEPDGVATAASIKVVLLIDKGSASASEIVAGALQDTKRATIVGETSYGKGTVQQWTALDGDAGGYRLTIAKWLTPDKRWIHKTGIEPDIAVTVPSDTPAGKDPVLDRALEVLGGSASLAYPRAA